MSTTLKGHFKRRTGTKRMRASVSPPDLSLIVYAFLDAQALVSVAHQVIVEGDRGPEEYVLRQGVEALERVSDQLDEAERQLARFLKANKLARDRS